MFGNLKLRGRIFLGFSTPVILIFAFSIIAYGIGTQLSEKFYHLNRAQQVLAKTDEMVLRTALMARQVRGYLLIKSEDPLTEFANQKELYDRAVEFVDEKIIDPNQEKLFQEMVSTGKDYYAMSLKTFQLKDEGKHDEAVNLYLKESKAMVGKLDALGSEFNEEEQEILAEYAEEARESIQFLIATALLTALLSLALASGAASMIWSTISKTNKTINETINTIITSSTEISATVQQQERSSSVQATSVNQTTTTMHQLGASSQQSAQQAESAAQKAGEVLALAESSLASARKVLFLADSSAQGAREVLSLSENGNHTVGRTLEEITLLKEKVSAIAEQIVRLSHQTSEIGTITNMVTDLANQTNMLSLNAAVEAVRAGEQGKGFGVVATEIRKLADQSKKSAEKINHLVFGIQSAINSTVIVTDEGRKTAEEGIQLSRKTADAFSRVTKAINESVLKSSLEVATAIEDVVLNNQQTSLNAMNDVVLNNQQIFLTSQQQAIAIQEVVEAMNALDRGATETVCGITQTKVGIEKLNEGAHSLKTLV